MKRFPSPLRTFSFDSENLYPRLREPFRSTQRTFSFTSWNKIISKAWKYISKALKYISKLLKYISVPLKKFMSTARRNSICGKKKLFLWNTGIDAAGQWK